MDGHDRGPADFVTSYILDVSNWEEMAAAIPVVSSVVKAPKCTWEGEPWRPGTVFAMRGAAIGISMTVHCKVVLAEEGELCRFEQQVGVAFTKQTMTYSYAVRPIDAETCELTYRTFVEGLAGRLSPTMKNPRWSPARRFASVIEGAWRRTRQSDTGQPSSAAGRSTVGAPDESALTCATCGTNLAKEALFCHSCGARVGAG